MRYFVAILGILLLAGCNDLQSNKPQSNNADRNSSPTANSTRPTDLPPAEDTSKTVNEKTNANQNDRVAREPAGKTTLTPLDQKENQTDIDITANIRKRVMQANDFSTAAQNVKIITQDGKVTLTGKVKNETERSEIEKIAHDVAGQSSVNSQLEVKP